MVALGFSLDGHIVIEVLRQVLQPDCPASELETRMRGLMIVGTPQSFRVDEVTSDFTWKKEIGSSQRKSSRSLGSTKWADTAGRRAFGGIS